MKLLKIQNLKLDGDSYPKDVIVSFGKYHSGYYFKFESPFKTYGEYRDAISFDKVKGYYRNAWVIKYTPGRGFAKIHAKIPFVTLEHVPEFEQTKDEI
jgi:hypothetical protein